MSHISPEPPGRRRVDLIVGALLALLGIAVAVIAVIALHNPKGRQAAKISASVSPSPSAAAASVSASPSASASAATSASATSPSNTPTTRPAKPASLIVLDNTGDPSLAHTAAARFTAKGWQVTATDELVNDILSTAAYYDPNTPGARKAAQQLQREFPAIKRVVPRFPELPAGPVVVVLTADYS